MDFIKKVVSKKETVIDGVILVLIALFLVSYFEPQYLLSKTTTTGGDTGSHYYTAWYLRHHLLPKGQISGWTQGNYAGFPMLESYFPLPFLLMVALSFFMSLQIAFKLITVLGIFSLPLCSYGALRYMKYAFPLPILGALFSLPFLFMEANSMWGGNIPSTLAGEFCFSLSISLSILFLGSFYQGITTGQHVIRNAVLIFLVGLSHSYTLLFTGLTSLFFLWTLNDVQNKWAYLIRVHLLGFLLMGFWVIPLLTYLPLTSGVSLIWIFQSFASEVFPKILWPFLGFAALVFPIELYRSVRHQEGDMRVLYIIYGAGIGFIGYLLAPAVGLSDARFIPFVQYFLMLLGAIGFHACTKNLKGQIVIPGIFYILMIFWVNHNVTYIQDWIAWNYNGFEKKNIWPQFKKVNERLRGSPSDPRVMYEHSQQHNATGTPRAFESLPFFSGRSTLEGIYLHASGNAPFILNIQSEISKEASCPFPQYSCSRHDINKGIKHLEMFNVRDVLVISSEVKAELRRHPKFQHVETIPPYEIYQLTTHSNRYVVPLAYEPILLKTSDWKTASYQWFKDFKNNDVHLVFPVGKGKNDLERFNALSSDALTGDTLLPRIPLEIAGDLQETIRNDEILFETPHINKPHLIKISYHPNWKVEGADQIYLVSPAFMLIYPTQHKVRLYYGQSVPDYIGKGFSVIGWGIILLSLSLGPKRLPWKPLAHIEKILFTASLVQKMRARLVELSEWIAPQKKKIRRVAIFVTIISLTGLASATYKQDAGSLLTRGIQAKDSGDMIAARGYFKKIVDRYPLSATAESARFYYGVSYYVENNCKQAITEFEQMIRQSPDTIWVPAAYYHIGLCHQTFGNHEKANETFQFIANHFPESSWAQYAQERLNEKELALAQHLFGQAGAAFNQGHCKEVHRFVQMLTERPPVFPKLDEALAIRAVCFLKEENYLETLRILDQLLKTFPQSALRPEAYYHKGLSYQHLKRMDKAEENYRQVIEQFPHTPWANNARQELETVRQQIQKNL